MLIKKDVLCVIILPWVVFHLSLLLPIISPEYEHVNFEYSLFFFVLFFIFYAFFIFGLQVKSKKAICLEVDSVVKIFLFILIIALVSRVLDRFLIRAPSNYFSISSYRVSREAGSNIFSILSVILFPVAIFLYNKIRTVPGKMLSAVNVFFFFSISFFLFDVVLSGSRGTALVVFVSLFFDKINKKNIIFFGSAFVVVSGVFFIFRFQSLTEVESISKTLLYLSSVGYSDFVPASDFFMSMMQESDFRLLYFSVVQITQYIAHGFFEFAYVYNTQPIVQFDPSRLIPQLSKISSFNSYLERENLYYTLMGTLYISFGAFSIFASAIIGLGLGFLYKRSVLISKNAKGVVFLSVFMAPFVNGVGGYDIHFFLLAIYIVSVVRLKNKYVQ
ncbi:hypothetical protein [Halomonas salinarum]|uniref:hypothetical protein n=1 Tax=Halomonas salinarum TaxID=1158993 RepID=UPI00143B30F8|nr:hypothetical protein [Halomonas salinarum]